MMHAQLETVTLTGRYVQLEPMTRAHVADLCAVGLVPELWRWTIAQVANEADMAAYVEAALAEQSHGRALPFVTRSLATGRIIGSTRYGNIDRGNRRLEIGWTWLTPDAQRTAANSEAKYLMLEHAFERLSCLRVEFKTDVLNTRSRAALARIGAVEEGVLRSHMLTEHGRVRDTVYFSIIAAEWPAVRERLRAGLHTTTPFR